MMNIVACQPEAFRRQSRNRFWTRALLTAVLVLVAGFALAVTAPSVARADAVAATGGAQVSTSTTAADPRCAASVDADAGTVAAARPCQATPDGALLAASAGVECRLAIWSFPARLRGGLPFGGNPRASLPPCDVVQSGGRRTFAS